MPYAGADLDRALDRRLGPGSTRHSTPSSEVAHTAPPPTAIPNRRLLPSSIALRMRFVRGSICEIVFSPEITHTPASPAAIAPASSGPRTTATRRPLAGSRRETVLSVLIAHTAPAPTAIMGKPSLPK